MREKRPFGRIRIAFSRRQQYQAFMISQHIQLAQGTYYRRS